MIAGARWNARHRPMRGLLGMVATMIVLFVVPSGASAGQPWEYPEGDPSNRRTSADSPPRFIGTVDRLGPVKTPTWRRTFDADITGTPIAARNGGVYVGDRGGVLHALVYSNGRTACSAGVGSLGTGTPPSPITGSPLYIHEKNTVYVVTNRPGGPRLVAVNALNCDPKWSTLIDSTANWEASDPTYSPAQNLIYVGTCVCTAEENNAAGVGGRGAVAAINADTGALVWKTPTVAAPFGGGAVAGTPIPYDPLGRVFVGTDHGFAGTSADPNTDAILALDEATGAIVGSYQARANDAASVATIDLESRLGFEAPLVAYTANGQPVVAGGDKGGTVYAINPSTMELVFKTDVLPGSSQGGIVGLGVDPATGVLHGTTEVPSTYFGVNPDGTLLYNQPATSPGIGPPSVAGRGVWAMDTAGFLNIQDVTDGRLIGRIYTGGRSIGGISFNLRRAYVAIGTGKNTGGGVVAYK